jgi:hypothetical protein
VLAEEEEVEEVVVEEEVEQQYLNHKTHSYLIDYYHWLYKKLNMQYQQ